jgi:hypothetical protein
MIIYFRFFFKYTKNTFFLNQKILACDRHMRNLKSTQTQKKLQII